MDHVATAITKDALENLGGVEMFSIGPLFAEHARVGELVLGDAVMLDVCPI
jgi:hypothetical protein